MDGTTPSTLLGSGGSLARLPKDLQNLVFNKLISHADYIRFGAVCKYWQSVALDQKQELRKLHHKQLPLLLTINRKFERNYTASLDRVTQGKTYRFNIKLQNVPNYKWFCGSSHGWLAYADGYLVITLLNPFTGRTIRLPRLPSDSDTYVPNKLDFTVTNFVLSADPDLFPNDYQALVIYYCRSITPQPQVAYFKPGTTIPWTHTLGTVRDIRYVIYHRGRFLFSDVRGAVFGVDVNSSSGPAETIRLLTMVEPSLPISSEVCLSIHYLVESSRGDLRLVLLSSSCKYFKVFELSCDSGDAIPHWVGLESIKGDALFVGDNESTSVSALDFPGCHRHSIYFIDRIVPTRVCVFNLENINLQMQDYRLSCDKSHMQSVWIVPSV